MSSRSINLEKPRKARFWPLGGAVLLCITACSGPRVEPATDREASSTDPAERVPALEEHGFEGAGQNLNAEGEFAEPRSITVDPWDEDAIEIVLSGRCLDTDGKPLVHAEADAYLWWMTGPNPTLGAVGQITTDPSGLFDFRCYSRTYEQEVQELILALYPQGALPFAYNGRFELGPGGQEKELGDLEAIPHEFAVAGKVVDESGRPIAGAQCLLVNCPLNMLSEKTDTDGAFRFFLRERGSWRGPDVYLDVSARGFVPKEELALEHGDVDVVVELVALSSIPRQESVAVPEPEVRFGQLRHVQLLEPRGETVRFATQVEIGTMDERWPVGRDTCIAVFEGESTEPVEELAVGASLIREFTWTERPAWFLFELEKAKRLAVIVPRRSGENGETVEGELRVLAFPGGEEVLSLGGVQEIEDALVHEGQAELVVRSGKQVRWLRLSESGEVVVDATVDLGLEPVACAAIARGKSGEELRAWGVGWRGDELFAVPFDATGADLQRAFRVTFDRGSVKEGVRVGQTLRATAWISESGSHLGVSWPGYCHGVGKLQVIDVSAEPKMLWEGRPYPEDDGNSLDVREFGQALAFVPDADEDGVPELLVTAPGSLQCSRVDLLSGRTGQSLKSWSPPGVFTGTGHSLSLSGDSRHALVGGTRWRGFPENLADEGQAHLLDVTRMEKLQTWKLPCRER